MAPPARGEPAGSASEAVLVFVREPVAGRVKTRLAAEIGDDAALRVYTRLAENTVAEATRLEPRAAVRIHFTPDGAGGAVRRWLGAGPAYMPQAAGDLGNRMREAFRAAFDDGFGRVVIVGSDLPGLSTALLRRALDLLGSHPAVIGPALDGGYYLLGLRAPRPELFDRMPWSTDRVLECTLHRLRGAGISPALLEPLRDVDRAADLPVELRGAWVPGA